MFLTSDAAGTMPARRSPSMAAGLRIEVRSRVQEETVWRNGHADDPRSYAARSGEWDSRRQSRPGRALLQGGGALGAYQGGVYQALHEAGVEPDWLIGTSIGAINASLIAGNKVEDRLPKLKEFWRRVEYSTFWGALPAWTGIAEVYLPVGNPAPDFYGEIRPGANLYTDSLVALDAKSGKLLWYQQFIPHDVHDADLSQVSPLFETTIDGKKHEVISVSGKDGLLRLLDRNSHEPIYEVPITTRENVDAVPTRRGRSSLPRLTWRHGVERARL